MTSRLGILVSGRGSNLQSLIDAIDRGDLDATIAIVISNRPDAGGLTRAKDAGLETWCLRQQDFENRVAYDRALADALEARRVDLVCLAGFMRLVGPPMLDGFPNRILNIHPSLLPAFPGLDAQKRAFDYGVTVAGATVHLVTDELDGGPIVMQAAVPVLPDDDVASMSARILVEEHRIYPLAVSRVLAGGWRIEGRRFVTEPGEMMLPGL